MHAFTNPAASGNGMAITRRRTGAHGMQCWRSSTRCSSSLDSQPHHVKQRPRRVNSSVVTVDIVGCFGTSVAPPPDRVHAMRNCNLCPFQAETLPRGVLR